MLRLTQIMRRLLQPAATARPRVTGPVVVWNLIRRCNLSCIHCYTSSADKPFHGELSLEEIGQVLLDLKAFGVTALILSGGEPLMHPDLFVIATQAKAMGFYLGLSSNGTLIDTTMARSIAQAKFDYVGVSLDGMEAHHDRMRGKRGAFWQSLEGIRNCRDQEVKAGIRFTPIQENIEDIAPLFDLMDKEVIDRIYLSHWNYAGRGRVHLETDTNHLSTRRLLDFLLERTLADVKSGAPREVVTGNNDADGVYLLLWIRRHLPELAQRAATILEGWGGNASGVGIANIDPQGEVHPDIFWQHYSLGNVRARPFSAIWSQVGDPVLDGLRQRPRRVKGRCGACRYLSICGGNTRIRAYQMTGDYWEEDPGCYLTDKEIF